MQSDAICRWVGLQGGDGGGVGVKEADQACEGQALDTQHRLQSILHSAVGDGGGPGRGGGLQVKRGRGSLIRCRKDRG